MKASCLEPPGKEKELGVQTSYKETWNHGEEKTESHLEHIIT